MKSNSLNCLHWHVLVILLAATVHGQDCTDPIGIESGGIPDASISASSFYDNSSVAARGRLNIKYQPPNKSGWCARENNQNQYLEIDLGAESEITRIATQGRGREPYRHWVSKYYVSFRTEDGSWFNFTRPGQTNAVIFEGNTDAFSSVFNSFNRTIKARYVRIHPLEWNVQICMRTELFGCLGEKLVIEDDDLLIMFIILLALAFCFVLLLLILLLTMRRLLKLLERRTDEKVRIGLEFRDSIDGDRMFKMDRSSNDTYIPEEPKQGTLIQTKKNETVNKDRGNVDAPIYATIQKSKDKTEDKNKKKNNQKEMKYKDNSDPETILVDADEEEEKRKNEEKNRKTNNIETIDL